jgi:hypothetical protein
LKRALEIWPAGQDADRRIHALKEMARCARHARDFGAARLAWEEILATSRIAEKLILGSVCLSTTAQRATPAKEEHSEGVNARGDSPVSSIVSC